MKVVLSLLVFPHRDPLLFQSYFSIYPFLNILDLLFVSDDLDSFIGLDKQVVLWRFKYDKKKSKTKVLHMKHTSAVPSIAYDPNGLLFSAGADKYYFVFLPPPHAVLFLFHSSPLTPLSHTHPLLSYSTLPSLPLTPCNDEICIVIAFSS